MGFDITGLGSLFDFGSKLIDKFFPDKAQADQAKIALLQMQQNGEFKELEERMKAITTEAASADPWTSRARPSFMYVIYLLILWSLPMGLASIFYPAQVAVFTAGFKGWLAAVPDSLWKEFFPSQCILFLFLH